MILPTQAITIQYPFERVYMDEYEWMTSEEAGKMFSIVRNRGSRRKLRLFACACCRLAWNVINDFRSREALRIAEVYALYADCKYGKDDLSRAYTMASQAAMLHWNTNVCYPAIWAARAVSRACEDNIREFGLYEVYQARRGQNNNKVCSDLLRDIFGNLFNLVVPRYEWLTEDVTKIIQAAYDNLRASSVFDNFRLQLLSDALEDAGCTNETILSHLREPSRHVLGCWVLDLLQGKE